MFPEGTRNHEGGLLPFKKGAFHLAVNSGASIVPVVIGDYRAFYCSRRKVFSPGTFFVDILPPVSTTGLRSGDVAQLTSRVEHAMRDAYERLQSASVPLDEFEDTDVVRGRLLKEHAQ